MSTIFYGYETTEKNIGKSIEILKGKYNELIEKGNISSLNECGATFYKVSERKVFIHIYGLWGRGSDFGNISKKKSKYLKNVSYNNQCDIPDEDKKNEKYVNNMYDENIILSVIFNKGFSEYKTFNIVKTEYRNWEFFMSNGLFGVQLDFKLDLTYCFIIGLVSGFDKYWKGEYFKYINKIEKTNFTPISEAIMVKDSKKGLASGISFSFIDEKLKKEQKYKEIIEKKLYLDIEWIKKNIDKYSGYHSEYWSSKGFAPGKGEKDFLLKIKNEFNIELKYNIHVFDNEENLKNKEYVDFIKSFMKDVIMYYYNENKNELDKFKLIDSNLNKFKKENVIEKIKYINIEEELFKIIIDQINKKSYLKKGEKDKDDELKVNYKIFDDINEMSIWEEFYNKFLRDKSNDDMLKVLLLKEIIIKKIFNNFEENNKYDYMEMFIETDKNYKNYYLSFENIPGDQKQLNDIKEIAKELNGIIYKYGKIREIFKGIKIFIGDNYIEEVKEVINVDKLTLKSLKNDIDFNNIDIIKPISLLYSTGKTHKEVIKDMNRLLDINEIFN